MSEPYATQLREMRAEIDAEKARLGNMIVVLHQAHMETITNYLRLRSKVLLLCERYDYSNSLDDMDALLGALRELVSDE